MSFIMRGAAPLGKGVLTASDGEQIIASAATTEWFRGDAPDVTVSNGTITQFTSRKTSARPAVQGTVAYQAALATGLLTNPHYPGTTYSAAYFNGAKTYTCGAAGGFIMGVAYTWAAILRVDTLPPYSKFYFGNNTSADVRSLAYVHASGADCYAALKHGNGYISKLLPMGGFHLVVMGHDTAHCYLSIDGVAATPTTTNNAVSTAQAVFGGINPTNGNSAFDGYIADLFVLNGPPAACTSEIMAISRYAKGTYGISVAGI